MKFAKYPLIVITLTATSIAFAHGPRAYLQEADANSDGKITKDEAAQLAATRFNEVDANKDGTISQAEVDAMKQKHRADFEQKSQARFASKDTNKDGKLQQSEVPNMPAGVFKKLDANADGGITAEEFRAHGPGPGRGPRHGDDDSNKGAGKHGRAKHGGLFKKMDANQDGNVTKAEAQAASEQHFTQLDKNSDGSITADEMPQHGGHRGPRPEGKK